MKDIDTLLKEVKRVHFIGIGGSGMCPLAEILHSWGYELSGRTIMRAIRLTEYVSLVSPLPWVKGRKI